LIKQNISIFETAASSCDSYKILNVKQLEKSNDRNECNNFASARLLAFSSSFKKRGKEKNLFKSTVS